MELMPYRDIVGAPYHHFRNWIIVQGREAFKKVCEDPSYLKEITSSKKQGADLFEELDFTASAVYYDREEKDPKLQPWDDLLNTKRRFALLEQTRSRDDKKIER